MYIPVPYFKNIPKMGDLEMDNIFWASDYPILFTCKNNEKLYLCLCTTVIDEQKWIISQIELGILKDLINNSISLYDALKFYSKYSCIARWNKNDQKETYEVVQSQLLLDEYLPPKSLYLDDEGDSSEYVQMVENRIDEYQTAKLDGFFKSNATDVKVEMTRISILETSMMHFANCDKVHTHNYNISTTTEISHNDTMQTIFLVEQEHQTMKQKINTSTKPNDAALAA